MRSWKVVVLAVVVAVLAFWVSLSADQKTAVDPSEPAVAKRLRSIANQPQLVFPRGAKAMLVPANCNLVVDITPPDQKDCVIHAVYQFSDHPNNPYATVTYVRMGTGKNPVFFVKRIDLDAEDTATTK